MTAVAASAVLLLSACGATGETANTAAETLSTVGVATVDVTAACTPITSAELIAQLGAGTNNSVSAAGDQLPLMQQLHDDTKRIWEQFEIQPDHAMVDGQVTILLPVWDAAEDTSCAEILAVVDRPDRVRVIVWAEEDYGSRSIPGGLPPWRALIQAQIAEATPAGDSQLWWSMGTGQYGVTSVTLRADQEELADALRERFGPLIRLSLGNFPFDGSSDPLDRSRCRTIARNTAPPALSVERVTWDGDRWAGQVEVTVRNAGDRSYHLVPARIAELTQPGSPELETQYPGAETAEARGSTEIAAGQAATFTARASSTSCTSGPLPEGSLEFALPIGVFDEPSFEGVLAPSHLVARLAIDLE